MARVRIYVDAFNVYYGGLKNRGPGYKWLDIAALASRCFPGHTIDKVVYCTARVSNHASNQRQDAYIRALQIQGTEIVEGQYRMREKRGQLVRPRPPPGFPPTVTIRAPEEKGSDVNLATRLLIDGFTGGYEQAIVMSMDTDLIMPMRYVDKTLRKPVLLLVNHSRADRKWWTNTREANLTGLRQRYRLAPLAVRTPTATTPSR